MSPTPSILVAVPKPPHIHREPKPMRRQNRKRAAASRVEDFGDLASFVRTLPCCVRGCESRDIDPAHVRAKRREIIAEMERERAAGASRRRTSTRSMCWRSRTVATSNPEKDRDKMLAALREKFDRTSASLFIDVVVKRTAAHQSTIKQAMLLVSKGIPADVAKTMTFARASAAMTELATMNWRPSPGWIEKYRQPEREVAA